MRPTYQSRSYTAATYLPTEYDMRAGRPRSFLDQRITGQKLVADGIHISDAVKLFILDFRDTRRFMELLGRIDKILLKAQKLASRLTVPPMLSQANFAMASCEELPRNNLDV